LNIKFHYPSTVNAHKRGKCILKRSIKECFRMLARIIARCNFTHFKTISFQLSFSFERQFSSSCWHFHCPFLRMHDKLFDRCDFIIIIIIINKWALAHKTEALFLLWMEQQGVEISYTLATICRCSSVHFMHLPKNEYLL
jgi:hypothetical protein